MIERELEAKIVAEIADVITERPVIGVWEAALTGKVKTRPRSCIEVSVKPRSCDGWGSDARTFQVTVSIEAAQEDDATMGTGPADYAAIVEDIFENWQSADDSQTAEALSVDGFEAQGFNFSDGGDCGLDQQAATWFALIQCEVKGIKSK